MEDKRLIKITYKSGKTEDFVYEDESMDKINKKINSPEFESWVLFYRGTEILSSKK